jgi:2-octaprenyl-6-methoxyphenol hydroxylase
VFNNSITILGAGISGMITALALAARNIKSSIIEKGNLSEEELSLDMRTTALSKSSQEILHSYGIWQYLEAFTTPILDIYVIDSHKSKSILHFPASLVKEEAMGFMIKNEDLRKGLYKAVKETKLIDLKTSMEYEKIDSNEFSNIIYLKDGLKIESELIIVCDGKFSRAKKQLFLNQIDKDYNQKAIIFNIKHYKNHCNFAIEHFLPAGPIAILPLKGGHESSIVWSQTSDLAEVLLKLPKPDFKEQVQLILGDSLGEFEIITPINTFPLTANLVDKYYNNNVIVLADAAHTIHPLAGQGLNLGIKDISALIPIIEQCRSTGLPFLSIYLEGYHKARKMDNLQMFFITDFLNYIFSNNSTILRSFRQAGLSIINSNNFMKSLLIKYAMGKLKVKNTL